MRLLNAEDVVKAVDCHTNEDGRLDDDITCILEEVPTAFNTTIVSDKMNEIGKKFCDSVKCSKNCKDCEHAIIMDALTKTILRGYY